MTRIQKVILLMALLTILIPKTFWEINWIEAVTITGLVIGLFIKWRADSKNTASKMWELGFDTIEGEWPPAPAIRRGQQQTLEVNLTGMLGSDKLMRLGYIHSRVKATRGVSVSEIDVRFVNKKRRLKLWPPWESISLWQWIPEDTISIRKLTDAHYERFIDFLSYDDRPIERFSGVGKVFRYPNPKALLAGDSFWLSLEIQGRESWRGYLEFYGPTPEGTRGYSRRKITVLIPKIPTLDTGGSQP